MPRMCGTNPEDLVRSPPPPPHLPPCSRLLSLHIPLLCCCTGSPPVLNIVSSHYVCIPSPPMTFFSISLFSGSLSHPLMFPTLWLLAPSRPHFPCHSLAPYFFFPPASSLIISFLYPSPPLRWLRSPDAFPLFPFSFSPTSISSPMVPATRQHWHGCKVHLHLCSRLRWTISMGVATLTLEEQRYYGNAGKRHVELPPPPSVRCRRHGRLRGEPRLQFEIQPVKIVAQMLACHHQLKSTIKVMALSSVPQNNIYF